MTYEEMKAAALAMLAEHRIEDFLDPKNREDYTAALMIQFAAKHAVKVLQEIKS